MVTQSEDAPLRSRVLTQGRRRGHPGLDVAAEWSGLALVAFVLGSAVVRLMTSLSDITGGPHPIGSLHQTGVFAGITALVVLASRRVTWPVITAAGLFAAWFVSAALSSWVLTGEIQTRPLWTGLTCFGLALGAAAARPMRAGWAILTAGTLLVYGNWWMLWRNYATHGAEFPRVLRRPYFTEGGDDLGPVAWLLHALQGDVPGTPVGLTPNGNLTGNFLAFFVVFSLPFLLWCWRHSAGRTPALRVALGALTVLLTLPGLGLLMALNARTAAFAAVIGWSVLLIPLPWFRARGWAWAAAVLSPLAIFVPMVLGLAGQVTLSGRDCVWHSWRRAISDSPIWGIGPPGRFPGVGCGVETWAHAHNELIQALSVGGVIGFAAAVSTVALLAWFGVRYASRDGRCLMVLVASGIVLLSMEIMSVWVYDWIGPATAAFVAVASRSLGMQSNASRP